jgi:starch phosphorylase
MSDPVARIDLAYSRSASDLSVDGIRQSILDHLTYSQGRIPESANRNDWYMALAYTVRDRLVDRWIRTAHTFKQRESRTVCYLSAEFLPGPQLCNNILSMGVQQQCQQAVASLGLSLDELLLQEEEPALGTGGLGRLAACYLDSLATLEIPAIGYGIRYEYGMFRQEIRDGCQVEKSDNWLRLGNPWEIPRPKLAFDVNLGGRTQGYLDDHGEYRVRWEPDRVVRGVACDVPVVGFGVETTNLLRLWKAEAPESFDFEAFNTGDYYAAVNEKVVSENLTKVLYPNDEPEAGKELRLAQQYFLVSCALQDMVRLYCQFRDNFDAFHEKFAVQLNDTHPALAIPELMHILVDRHHVPWDRAWEVTRRTFSYTNHTLLPEALEQWPMDLFRKVLPRHLEIIEEINQRFLDEVRVLSHSVNGLVSRLSIICEDGPVRYVRMANLACAGAHTINGVAELHTCLLRKRLLHDFHTLWPERFLSITNGVTPRRFLMLANQPLAKLLDRYIGSDWPRRLTDLSGLEQKIGDAAFREEWRAAKQGAKRTLAKYIGASTGISVDPESLFDIQVKRIHEYKRQHLNVLHIISLYNRLKASPSDDVPPRTFIFAGKAAPGYRMAKLVIRLIHGVADMINRDPDMKDRLRVVFLPDFNVKLAQKVYPAADLSEQISTAGFEASGTGNMKFAMNGAVTIGTLDGANVEIRDAVGAENFFVFGLSTPEVEARRAEGYRPGDLFDTNGGLKEALLLLRRGFFSHGDTHLFSPLVDSLLNEDRFMVLADYESYVETQHEAGLAYLDTDRWTRMSILNTARIGYFSSDRAVQEYAEKVWRAGPVPIEGT